MGLALRVLEESGAISRHLDFFLAHRWTAAGDHAACRHDVAIPDTRAEFVKGKPRARLLAMFCAFVFSAPHVCLATEGARLSGWTLSDDGLPLAGVEVVLACPPAPVRRIVSDEWGYFELVDLPPGYCRLRGTKRGYVDANIDGDPGVHGLYNLKVTQDAWRHGFELRLARGVILTGTITDARGRPVRNIRVHPIRREVANGIARLVPAPYRPVTESGAFEFTALLVVPGKYVNP
jgi:hypothetical protein